MRVFFGLKKLFVLFILICTPVLLWSQESDSGEDPDNDSEWDVYDQEEYVSGDQTFIISLGTVFPAVFINNGKIINHNFSPPVGGTGALAYNYYFNSHVFVGGEVAGMFMPTVRENTAFLINLGARGGYQFNIWRLEFPLSLVIGMSWHKYLSQGYYGFFMKGGGAAYFRFNPEWSFGLNLDWTWLPEWANSPSKNVHGNVIDLMLSARYHF